MDPMHSLILTAIAAGVLAFLALSPFITFLVAIATGTLGSG